VRLAFLAPAGAETGPFRRRRGDCGIPGSARGKTGGRFSRKTPRLICAPGEEKQKNGENDPATPILASPGRERNGAKERHAFHGVLEKQHNRLAGGKPFLLKKQHFALASRRTPPHSATRAAPSR
jgi:hypothetical protein